MDFSLIIPTYNEKENIIVLVRRITAVLTPTGISYEILVVDDDSPDLTWEIVETEFHGDNTVKVIRRTKNKGLSASVIDGFSHSSGDLLGVMDADLQHDENCLPEMLRIASSNDLVIGTRFSRGGSIEGGWPISRKISSALATAAAKIMLGVSVSDPMSGFFIVRKSQFDKISGSLDPKGFKILLEILHLLKVFCPNAKVSEVGIFFRKRTAGESKMDFKVIRDYFFSLVRLRKIRK